MMKRHKTIIAVLSICAVALSACGVNESQTKSDTSTKQAEQAEQAVEKIKDYGEKVNVKGKKMNVYTTGTGDKKIVLLPGLGEFSQVYSHHNLIEELAKTYKVVVVEPFGYGLSDTIDEPRTIDNITEEIHEALDQLDIKEYLLMGHSIAGVYGLNYSQKYPEEVLGFVGLDTSTPTMHGEARVDVEPTGKDQIDKIAEVDKEINKQYRLIGEKIAGNASNADESKRSYDNIHSVEDVQFPKGFPALYFLGQENVDEFETTFKEVFKVKKGWVEQHEDLSEDPKDAEVHVLDDGHFLFEKFYKEIAEKVRVFDEKNKIWEK